MTGDADASSRSQGRLAGVVRRLMRGAREGALATSGADGYPFASLVTVATDLDGSLILLLSGLADHTKNLLKDPRCSLLLKAHEGGLPNPQTGARVTVIGRLEQTDDEDCAKRFLARHPGAALYAGFADFSFYRMDLEQVRYVGGFAAAATVPGKKILLAKKTVKAFEKVQGELLDLLNGKEQGRLAMACRKQVSGRGKKWKALSLDPDGVDVACGARQGRLDFDGPVDGQDTFWQALNNLI